MLYLNKLILPSERAETLVIKGENRTRFNTFYPFNIFPLKMLREVKFDGITVLYGGNGSGKSTLINLIAKKINAVRYSEFNDSPFFDKYADMSHMEFFRYPENSCVLTSDDVFDYALKARSVNENIDDKRNELIDRYIQTKRSAVSDPGMLRLKSLDDYESWSETIEILSPRKSQSSYIKKRVTGDIDLHSNGETAMKYFLDRIDGDAVYLLDEPENSLSVELQLRLSEYISSTALATRSQFVIATHSPVLLSMKNTVIYNLDARPVDVCKWTELPNVRRYFDFFMEHKNEFD